MFKRHKLLILGAGASAEVGVPPGKELTATIGKKMDIRYERMDQFIGERDESLFKHVVYHYHQHYPQFNNAAWLIRDGHRLGANFECD